jgi:hypothetical protein
VTSEFKKTTIEIESVTTTGSAFASSCEGSVFVPAKIVEQSDVQEGDIIYATIRENYEDKRHVSPWLCSRLHIDHADTILIEEPEEEAPQSPPPNNFENVVPLVHGTELISAARDQMFLILLGLAQPELNDMVLDVVEHADCTAEDILFSILSINAVQKSCMSELESSAYLLIESTIAQLYSSTKIVKNTTTSFCNGEEITMQTTYSNTQRARAETIY